MLIHGLRAISVLEGLSYLYLLYCSLYLKRVLGDEHAIDTPGMIHGVLFVTFAFLLFICWIRKKLRFKDSALVFIASLIPFGFIWIEKRLHKKPA